MGIPKFFRWLSGRYPLVCERISDDNIPEFDNLYLDMNGIIHNCTHPKDGEAPAPATDEERFLAIFYYIDFLFNKIRPQKVFFLGIDGVAPRAKMNEQRARRFRTAQELKEQHDKELAQRRANGEVIRPEDEESSDGVFDPTCITPGTEFMDKLTEALRYYINKRVSEDANWRKPQIILSAPNVPGEGEHKIMDYIRFSRAQPGYNPNVRHCLYGLDADLIMLGLLSHEPHFSLLREEVLFGGRGQKNGASADPSMQAFYLLHISVLRDYLDHEFGGLKSELGCSAQYVSMERDGIAASGVAQNGDSSNAFDLERIIDDYILMIMLVGNDFLPNLPKLSINGGALNFMFATYTRIRPLLGGYLHDNGILNLERLELFMREIAKFEVDSFKLEVANHQWYQVYKHKAVLRGETPEESSIVEDYGRGGGGRNRRRGLGANRDRHDDYGTDIDYSSVLGEAATPIKGSKLVISKSQEGMLELIRRFAQRALPKVAVASHKVQMQFLPGPATALDTLIVKRAGELLGIHVGHEYAHDGSMTLYVAVGSPRAIAKLEFEDTSSSTGEESKASSVVNFVSASSTSFQALGGIEDDDDGYDIECNDELCAKTASQCAVPDFVERVSDVHDEAAVAEYVAMRLRELDNVLVVPDSELDLYTQTGDVSDFWQRFELWKAAYYGAKLEIVYDAPSVGDEASGSVTASGQRFRSPAPTVEPMCRSYIGSLQWVLQYYYRGCQSWSWYYPYHYAPCISDICANLVAYKVESFPNDEPYTPYEQLMCVLPPYSRKLLPPALRSLMVDVCSPIHDMYPTSFSVDMNGKKMPWEAVVLIDFVDADRIRTAMKPQLQLLSEDEQRRNSRGTSMSYSYTPIGVEDDAADAPVYTAPSNLKFPPIKPLKCKGVIYIMPSLKAKGKLLQLVSGLIRGASTRAKMLSGFPSLFTVEHTAQLAFNGTEVFGFPSRDESMQIEIQHAELGEDAESIAPELLNGKHTSTGDYRPRRLFVAWPYLRDAVLVGVSDRSGTYTMDNGGTNVIFLEHEGAGERQVWTRRYMDAVHQAKKTQAVITSDSAKVLVHVLHLRGLELFPDGSLVRSYGFPSSQGVDASRPWMAPGQWSEAGVQAYPVSLVSTDLTGAWVNNPRFMEHDAIPLDQALAVKDRAFFLGRTPLYGSPAKVIGHAYGGAGTAVGVDLQLVANVDSKHDNFLAVNTLAHQARLGCERYVPSYAVARDVGVSPLLLSRITSKMMLMDESKTGDSARVHVGLDLKFEAKRLKVSGFTRRGPSGWQFSDRAIDLISRYKQAFPRMFAQLEATKSTSSLITASECFWPEQPDTDARAYVSGEIKRVRQWLKNNVDRNTMVQVPIESDLLSKDQIAAIVAARASVKPAATKKVVIRGVRREAALRPVDAEHILKGQSLMVGHRVVYVSDRSGSVPFGAKGYVVGIHARETAQSLDSSANSQYVAKLHQEGVPADMIAAVEIVLDRPFIDGTTLDGRCPPQRGALVRPYQILDLTSWGLGQNAAAAKPSAVPRSVDVIAPAPDTLHQKRNAAAGQTANVAAKARVYFGKTARAGPDGVSVPEPRRAPWADSKSGSPQQAARDQDHASRIMSQLTRPRPPPPPPPPSQAIDDNDNKHARNIINTLLAGPMQKLAITKNTPVAGQCPIVIEEEYLSDSMDEDDAGETARSRRAPPPPAQSSCFYYNYSNDRPPGFDYSRGHSRAGYPRGRSRGRGRGTHSAHAPNSGAIQQPRTPQDGPSTGANQQPRTRPDGPNSWRGRGRGRGSKNFPAQPHH